jgi:hypothetical protein
MKKVTVKSKLSLKKETIAQLSLANQKLVQGGTGTSCIAGCETNAGATCGCNVHTQIGCGASAGVTCDLFYDCGSARKCVLN